MKKLYRSHDRWIAGVCGGFGEYFDIDPLVIRIIWIIAILFMGTGILLYIIFWLVIPEK